MDAVEFIKTRRRMQHKDSMVTPIIFYGNAEDIVAETEKWAKENPNKTRQNEFLKIYPEAQISKTYGFIEICPADLIINYRDDGGHCSRRDIDCVNCRREFWLKEIE